MTDPTQSASPSPTRRALLIGINKYPQLGPTSQLRGCVNDILDVHSFLIDHAGFPGANVRLLLSELDERTLPSDLGPVGAPDSRGIRQAFNDLSDGIQPGDEVVIYYSGHGVRIKNPQNAKEQIGAIAAMDVHFDDNGKLVTDTLIINRELNKALQTLLAAGATVTAVLDACHSGGATRDVDDADASLVREFQAEVSAAGWERLVAEHDLGSADLTRGNKWTLETGGATSLSSQQNLIVLSGCRDIETSKEFPLDTRRNGCLTYFLMDSLKNVKADETSAMTWQNLYPQIRQGVNGAYADQTPTLEGRAERPLFGGDWRAYDPGFTVSVTPGSNVLVLDGGTIQGLGPGAQVAIYPPATVEFATAQQQAVAQVDDADLVTSRAHVVSGASTVADRSRARLVKPAGRAPHLGVRLTDVPATVAQAIAQAPGVADFVVLNPDKARPDFEIRPKPAGSGWVLVPFRSTTDAPDPNDVIAQSPGLNVQKANVLGMALGLGLVQWAKYWAVLTRRNTDDTLRNALSLTLLAGDDPGAMFNNPNDPTIARPVSSNAAGVCEVTEADNLLVKVGVSPTSPANLTVGILLCSNDGDIQRLWPPPNAESSLAPGDEKVVGRGSDLRPFTLTAGHTGRTGALYTFKAFATNVAASIDLSNLEQEQTVQDVIDAVLASAGEVERGGFGSLTAQPPRVLWTTVECPVLVKKAAPSGAG